MSCFARTVAIGLVCLMAAAVCRSASAQPGGRGPGGGFGAMGELFKSTDFFWARLLRSEKVQAELKLTDDQKAKLKELDEKTQAQFRELMPRGEAMQALRDLSEEQQKAKVAEARKKIEKFDNDQQDAIEKILKTDHLDRLEQIALQVRGLQAFEDKEVQDAVGLSADQKEKLKTLRDEATKKRSEIFASGDWQGMREKMTTLQKDTDAKITAVLTAKQLEKFEQLKGPKIDGDPSELLGRGGFGGRRGGPPRE
ncbi:MAG: Spy/CpxP family protein refolding chaperone [Planctomycetota bacterium]|nr:Spy/CpxP family protein refolding chaperone [Planctomycetota bacterium]